MLVYTHIHSRTSLEKVSLSSYFIALEQKLEECAMYTYHSSYSNKQTAAARRCSSMPSNHVQSMSTATFLLSRSSCAPLVTSFFPSLSLPPATASAQEKNACCRAVNLLTVLMIHQQIHCSHMEVPFLLRRRRFSEDEKRQLNVPVEKRNARARNHPSFRARNI